MTFDIERMNRNRKAGTPGPWWPGHFADDSHSCECRSILSENGPMGGIAEIGVDNGLSIGEGGNDAPPLEEAKANALRIADTPAMENRILFDADRIAQLERDNAALERERDEARRMYSSDCGILLAAIDQIEEATGEGPEGEDVGLIYQIRNSVAGIHTSAPEPEADDKTPPTDERARLTSAGEQLDQTLGEFIDFSDFETSYDPDGEKWVSMHASHWEALLSDARDARAAWSVIGQTKADGEVLRERVAFAMWREEAAEGLPKSVWKNRTPQVFADLGDQTRSKWLRLADAAIRAVRGDQ